MNEREGTRHAVYANDIQNESYCISRRMSHIAYLGESCDAHKLLAKQLMYASDCTGAQKRADM